MLFTMNSITHLSFMTIWHPLHLNSQWKVDWNRGSAHESLASRSGKANTGVSLWPESTNREESGQSLQSWQKLLCLHIYRFFGFFLKHRLNSNSSLCVFTVASLFQHVKGEHQVSNSFIQRNTVQKLAVCTSRLAALCYYQVIMAAFKLSRLLRSSNSCHCAKQCEQQLSSTLYQVKEQTFRHVSHLKKKNSQGSYLHCVQAMWSYFFKQLAKTRQKTPQNVYFCN